MSHHTPLEAQVSMDQLPDWKADGPSGSHVQQQACLVWEMSGVWPSQKQAFLVPRDHKKILLPPCIHRPHASTYWEAEYNGVQAKLIEKEEVFGFQDKLDFASSV